MCRERKEIFPMVAWRTLLYSSAVNWADQKPRGPERDKCAVSPRHFTLANDAPSAWLPLVICIGWSIPCSLSWKSACGDRFRGCNKPGYGSIYCQHFSGGPMFFCQASIFHYDIKFLALIAAEEAWSACLPHPAKAQTALQESSVLTLWFLSNFS